VAQSGVSTGGACSQQGGGDSGSSALGSHPASHSRPESASTFDNMQNHCHGKLG